MLAIRYRVELLSEHLADSELDMALHERWAEGSEPAVGEPTGEPSTVLAPTGPRA
jgi:hypothetical protein